MRKVHIGANYMRKFDADPKAQLAIVHHKFKDKMPPPDSEVELVLDGEAVGTARVLRWFVYGRFEHKPDGSLKRRKIAPVNAFIITDYKERDGK